MEKTRLNLNVSEEFSEGLTAVCEHIGISRSYFIEEHLGPIVEDFLTDLEGNGNGPLADFIMDRSWSRKDAERMAGILRGLPRCPASVDLHESEDYPGLYNVTTTRKEVA